LHENPVNVPVKIALVTTTIHVPKVLGLYRELAADVPFFIAGDRRTPHAEVTALARELGNAVYYSDVDQEKLGYRCSELIGWNRVMRRNIALLEAIRSGADVIVSVDDDNVPVDRGYFERFAAILGNPYDGPMATSPNGWFDAGRFLDPPVHHRGFPYDRRGEGVDYVMTDTRGARVGVAAGLWLGDPDVDAMERIVNRPRVRRVSDVIRRGLCLEPGTWTPINSQNTAWLRELAPLFMVWSGVGRYDDIWASYFAQRIFRELGYAIHFGPPLVRQNRHPHDLWRDLREELFGMEKTPAFCRALDGARLGDGPILERMQRLYAHLRQHAGFLPDRVFSLGEAWCADVARVASP
jgi:hypothetical protein